MKPHLHFPETAIKRVVDYIFSAIGLIVLLPVITVVAAMIRLTSPGPAFFRQLCPTE